MLQFLKRLFRRGGTSFDYGTLRTEMAEGARKAFRRLQAEQPTETFYAFALYTGDDVMGIDAAANSEESYRYGVERAGLTTVSELSTARWSTPEWFYEGGFADCLPSVYDPETDEPKGGADGFAGVVGRVFAAMVLGLEDLDREGLFGIGNTRHGLTLFCSVSDSPHAPWLEDESARRLNPSDVYQVFRDEWLLKDRVDAIAQARRYPSAVYRAFKKTLSGSSGLYVSK